MPITGEPEAAGVEVFLCLLRLRSVQIGGQLEISYRGGINHPRTSFFLVFLRCEIPASTYMMTKQEHITYWARRLRIGMR